MSDLFADKGAGLRDDVVWFRQAAIRWKVDGRTIYIDPWGVGMQPEPADLIFITHAHYDHFVPEEIERLRTPATRVIAPKDVAAQLPGEVLAVTPGESHEIEGVRFATVPMYNVRREALSFHPKSKGWTGYVIEAGGRTHFHAGDTDHIDELESVRADVAYLPIGGHFTMDAEEAADLAKVMSPGLAVPIHFGFVIGTASDGQRFAEAAAPVPVEVLTPVNPFER